MCDGHLPKWREAELDATLLSLFRQWEELLLCVLNEEEMQRIDLLTAFCDDVQRALVRLAPEHGIAVGGDGNHA